jgi:amino acid transporter
MARDASLPELMARVHGKFATPHYAILFSALIIIVMAVALPIEQVAAAASVMFMLLFGGVNVAVVRLRKSHPDLDRGFKVPWVPYTPIVARGLKAALLAIVGALGLWQLDFAREIVMAAFIISFGAAGVAFAVAVGLGSARAIQHGWEVLFEKRKGD